MDDSFHGEPFRRCCSRRDDDEIVVHDLIAEGDRFEYNIQHIPDGCIADPDIYPDTRRQDLIVVDKPVVTDTLNSDQDLLDLYVLQVQTNLFLGKDRGVRLETAYQQYYG